MVLLPSHVIYILLLNLQIPLSRKSVGSFSRRGGKAVSADIWWLWGNYGGIREEIDEEKHSEIFLSLSHSLEAHQRFVFIDIDYVNLKKKKTFKKAKQYINSQYS